MSLHHILFATYAGAHQISRSLRLNIADSANLSRTPGGAGNRKILAGRARIKRATLGATQVIMSAGTTSIDRFYFDSSDRLCLDVLGTARLVTTAVFRDPMAWLDVGFELDVGNGTAGSRAKIFIEEVEASAYSTDTRSSIADTDTNWNNTVVHYIGRDNGGNYFGGYMSEPALADGSKTFTYSALDAVSGVKMPARPNATWGTNGFYLDFSDNSNTTSSTLGKDRSGNSNDWTPNNFSVSAGVGNDSLVDTPTNYSGPPPRGNYITWNQLVKNTNITISDGNLRATSTASAASYSCASTFPLPTTGKWFVPFNIVARESTTEYPIIGLFNAARYNGITANNNYPGNGSNSDIGFGCDRRRIENGTNSASYMTSAMPTGTWGILAVDMDAKKLWIGHDGAGAGFVWQNSGDPSAGSNQNNASAFADKVYLGMSGYSASAIAIDPAAEGISSLYAVVVTALFAAGFQLLSTQNLSNTTVALPASFTGNASTDGPFVWANGVVETVTINGNVATRGTHFDAVAGGMKLRTSSSSYNTAGSNTISAATYGAAFKYARAQGN